MQLLNSDFTCVYWKFEKREKHRSCRKARRLTELTELRYCTKVKVLGTAWSQNRFGLETKRRLLCTAAPRGGQATASLCYAQVLPR